jgi:hypothetical protein
MKQAATTDMELRKRFLAASFDEIVGAGEDPGGFSTPIARLRSD